MDFFDKHGKKIEAGHTIIHSGGSVEKVYRTVEPGGGEGLGVNASNWDFLLLHPDCDQGFYPLYSFDMGEWEIIDIKPTIGDLVDVITDGKPDGRATILKIYQYDRSAKELYCKVVFDGQNKACDRIIKLKE